jgi:hypothetical protein
LAEVAPALKPLEMAMEKDTAGRWVTVVEMWDQAEASVAAAIAARERVWAASTGKGRRRDALLAAMEANHEALHLVRLADRFEDQWECLRPGKESRA